MGFNTASGIIRLQQRYILGKKENACWCLVSIPQAVSSSCNSVLGNPLQDWIKIRIWIISPFGAGFSPKSPWTVFWIFPKTLLKPAWLLHFSCPRLCWIIGFPTFLYYSGFPRFLSIQLIMIRFLTIPYMILENFTYLIKLKNRRTLSRYGGQGFRLFIFLFLSCSFF